MKQKSINLLLKLIVFGSFNLYFGSSKSEATQLEIFDSFDLYYSSHINEEAPDHGEYYDPEQPDHNAFYPQEIASSVVIPARQQREPSDYELSQLSNDRQRRALYTWYEIFNELIEYCEIHGHCNVPQKYDENPRLGIWVNKQRMEKKHMDDQKKSSMTQTKIDNLESIGFKWAQRKGQHAWIRKYIELRMYYEQYGDCEVPTKYKANPSLGRWISSQRSEYKRFLRGISKHMTQERVDLLNALEFTWDATKSKT